MNKELWMILTKTLLDIAEMIEQCKYQPDERLVKALEKLLGDTLEQIKEK